MTFEKEALEIIKRLIVTAYEERNLKAIFEFLADSITWIGAGEQEMYTNLNDIILALSNEQKESPSAFLITGLNLEALKVSLDTCIVYGNIEASSTDPEIADISYRLSAVCVAAKQEIKICHVHISANDSDQAAGEYFVKAKTKVRRIRLADIAERSAEVLRIRERELSALTENIPGGVHQCKNDKVLTIINMSDSFLTLTGYSHIEIECLFQNHYINLIHQEDREMVLSQIETQLSAGSMLELEYRIKRKDGEIIWIFDKGKLFVDEGGNKTFYCILLDITEQKEQREELRLSLERHKVIMDQTTDIIFEWDIINDTLTFSSNWKKKFGYDPIETNISKNITLSDNVHEEDKPKLIGAIREVIDGKHYTEIEIRIRDIMDLFIWCRIRATCQYCNSRRPVKAIGVVINIDEEKKRQQKLLEQARQDALTGLLNKEATKNRVEEFLKSNTQLFGALMIIDLDDFKQINDRFGHLCGDSVLSDTAVILKNKFRAGDIVGRIGGDEFLAFLPGINEEKAAEFSKAITKSLSAISVNEGQNIVSCSLGVSFFPRDGIDFFTLYRLADKALYYVKKVGKGGYFFYDQKVCLDDINEGLARSAVNTVIDSEVSAVNQQLAQYSFRMFYRAIDIKAAVRQMLEIIGRAYDVSRAYIFESSEDGTYCINTFEWCAEGIVSQMDNLQKLYYHEMKGFFDGFDENGVTFCNDIKTLNPELRAILEPQGICSILLCSISDDGNFKGFVGFDECRTNRVWIKDQVDSLTLTANVLSVFLLKLRLKERLMDTEKKPE